MTETTLKLIDLDQKIEGYRKFLSCWAYLGDGLTFVVDPGPLSTTPHLIETLKQHGIERLDYILLTHIHLDHGGGTHEVLRAFPDARVYCHEIGRKHLAHPEKLWQGSKQVLGNVAEIYGKPESLPEKCLIDEQELINRGIVPISTPGHAPHHVAFQVDDILFAGEAIGTRLDLPSGKPYLRPATPPRFILDEALRSLDALLALTPEPKRTAFAHYGLVPDGFKWCNRAKKQLEIWIESIRELWKESSEDLEHRLYLRLMEIDPYYGQGRFEELPDDIRKRERHFLGNTLDGMLGYIQRGNG